MFHVELAPLGGIFGPLKSDLGVFWPFRETDFIMGKNKNPNFSKRSRQIFLIFSLSSLFISVLKVPEEKLASWCSSSQVTLVGHAEVDITSRKSKRRQVVLASILVDSRFDLNLIYFAKFNSLCFGF